MDELSHFTGASKLTVNIRGNDIDFKVLWLQMSLVRSFSFCLLRKKKKKGLGRSSSLVSLSITEILFFSVL